jgi:hypothetical protein
VTLNISSNDQRLLVNGSVVFPGNELGQVSPRLVFENNCITFSILINESAKLTSQLEMRVNGEAAKVVEQKIIGIGRKKLVMQTVISEDALVEIIDSNTKQVLNLYRARFCLENAGHKFSEANRLTRLRRLIG